jgi:hydroxymethylglutaryl-CoA synthase
VSIPTRDGVGIVGVGIYLPFYRLQRNAIAATLETPTSSGARCVASYDEDSTTMAVEATRMALKANPTFESDQVILATTSPAYEDKSNAAIVHAALGFDRTVFAADFCGSVRSAIGALRMALNSTQRTSLVLSDIRNGLPGSDDEKLGGDAASALLVGQVSDNPLATLVSEASVTTEVLERWRAPGEESAQVWEERFGEHVYVPLGVEAFERALRAASLTAENIDHLVVVGLHERAVRLVVGQLGVKSEALVDVRRDQIGNSATAMIGIAISTALRRSRPGEHIMLISLADGADAFVFRATEKVDESILPDLDALISSTTDQLAYARYLTWRGQLVRQPPRRPDPVPPAAPPSLRSVEWKYAFTGSECVDCGTVQVPPRRVCISCRSVDNMKPIGLANTSATLATFTVDHIALSLSPPVAAGVVDFDGGGRYRCELTDCEPDHLAVGDRVEMTFRRAFTAKGVHNYVWKARTTRETV